MAGSSHTALRILRISGEEVLSLSEEDVSDVGPTILALKKHVLERDYPDISLYRLRLVRDGDVLPDSLDWTSLLGDALLQLSVVVLDFAPLDADQGGQFLKAVKDARTADVETFLRTPADPNGIFAEYVEALDNRSEVGAPLLWFAAAGGFVDVARLLLRAKAQVNLGNAQGMTPLCAAVAYRGDWDTVQLLLRADADPDCADDHGDTPFLHAASTGRLRIAEVLILVGADPKRANALGQSPLWTACDRSQWDFVRFLILPQLCLQEPADVNQADSRGVTPLWLAAGGGEFSTCNLLLFVGADKDRAEPASGETPLAVAASNGHLSTVQLLLLAGADKERPSARGLTPAEMAEEQGHTDVAQLLRTWSRAE